MFSTSSISILVLLTLAGVPAILARCTKPSCSYSCGMSIGSDGCAQCDCSKRPTDSDCPSICPADCGQTTEANGCLKCNCNVGPWWQKEPKPDCPKVCPADCGQERLPNGCLKCNCNVGPWFPVHPPPSKRDCPQVCPADCGQERLPNGCLKCDCNVGPWFPVHPPPPKRDCPQVCPADCGQIRLSNGCLKCECDNVGPWFGKYPTPQPPRRGRGMRMTETGIGRPVTLPCSQIRCSDDMECVDTPQTSCAGNVDPCPPSGMCVFKNQDENANKDVAA
uniref:Antistasin-like domain-containing protein n=1 Tax=Strigamia maritima TaxID=126957 RepID=T1J7Y8_STRMM